MLTTKADRREKEYQYLKQVLQNSEYNSVEKIQTHMANITRRSQRITAIIVVIAIILCVIWQQYIPFWIFMTALIVLWMWGSTSSGRKLMQRYINEELTDKKESE